ncbi:MAG: ATPase, T2SS/T4P/T4SS family [bacterium]|nr:ATPase, T2SS/T4P/T4SS family [bacterium]
MPQKIDIIELLLSRNLITQDAIDKAKEESKRKNLPLEKTLENLGFVTEKDIARTRADALNVPYMDLTDYAIDPEVIKLIPEDTARKCKLIPLFKIADTLTVAMADPLDISAIDKIYNETGKTVEVVVSGETDIMNAILQSYKISEAIAKTVDDIGAGLEIEIKRTGKKGIEAIEEVPVVKAVNLMIMQAVKDKASDIHIEPNQNVLRVRYRIDGVLHEVLQLPTRLQPVIVSRIKVLAGMNIAEKRIAQDGHIEFTYEGEKIDLRVSSYPVILGEKIVIRLLRKTGVMYGIKELGFTSKEFDLFNNIIKQPYGIMLVTGPTGSGKTTTLYAALQEINTLERNIITLEDPVEYQMNILNQSQINPKAGWTFAAGLRSILRQDPDVIMVGEIRDLETAEIAIQAALTGHLVLSTLHTNDAPSTATRLIDMGVEPFLVSASLIGAIAQRLVRLICPNCKEEYKPREDIIKGLFPDKKNLPVFHRGKGCKQCSYTGYKGRLGIYEIMVPNDEIKALIVSKAAPEVITKEARKMGMLSLREEGLYLVTEGKTTIEELIRVTQDEVIR